MGYMRHNAIVAVVNGYIFGQPEAPDVEAFRASLPAEWRHLVVGPVKSVMNDYVTFVFAADGSKEGWGASDNGDLYREQFVDLFRPAYEKGYDPSDVLIVDARFGGDEPGGYGEDELIVSTNFRDDRVRLDMVVDDAEGGGGLCLCHCPTTHPRSLGICTGAPEGLTVTHEYLPACRACWHAASVASGPRPIGGA